MGALRTEGGARRGRDAARRSIEAGMEARRRAVDPPRSRDAGVASSAVNALSAATVMSVFIAVLRN